MSEIESIKTATDALYDYKFNLVLNSDIQRLSNGVIKEFGDIQVTEHTSNLKIKELKIEQAQMQQNVQPRCTVAGIKLQLTTKVDIKKDGQMNITGCAILSNGHLLYANYTFQNNIFEYNEDGNHIDRFKVSATPYDIAVLDSDRIAITYGYKRFFEIFNYRNSRIEKKIQTGDCCWRLDYSNGKIYVKLHAKVGVYDITGQKLCIVTVKGKDYISASNGSLVCSNFLNNNVYCYDLNEKEAWKFHDDSLVNP
ncbi:unnamed protein product [Mytilus edulis]|uniref:Uncharacterized protein n=1 Tax=Mytilus edulis TaxID=6550 RepID=A0A8S3V858_MYTED|nr:unnamed protein product [Mytilus edulis]